MILGTHQFNQPSTLHLSNKTTVMFLIFLALQEGASGIDIKKGGAFKARSIKTHLEALLARFFLHRKGWGIKITSEKFFEIGF